MRTVPSFFFWSFLGAATIASLIRFLQPAALSRQTAMYLVGLAAAAAVFAIKNISYE